MTAALRLVPEAAPSAVEGALRPTSFDAFIGQAAIVTNLRGAVRAAKRGGWQLDHVLMTGPAGLGKSSLAAILATELGARVHATSAPAIEHKGQLASLLTALGEGDVLFIDEIHALDHKIAECLFLAMEDRILDLPAGKRMIRVPLPRFTLVGATTNAGKLPKPLLDRFGFVCQLQPYTLPEMRTIVARSADKLGVAIDDDGCTAIAQATHGTPRLANRLLRRVRDMAANAAADGAACTVNGALATAVLAQLGIDSLGLGALERQYLELVADRPVGIEALCAALGEARVTLEEVIEPTLVQLQLIARMPRGRVATDAGRAHLGVTP